MKGEGGYSNLSHISWIIGTTRVSVKGISNRSKLVFCYKFSLHNFILRGKKRKSESGGNFLKPPPFRLCPNMEKKIYLHGFPFKEGHTRFLSMKQTLPNFSFFLGWYFKNVEKCCLQRAKTDLFLIRRKLYQKFLYSYGP